MMFLTSAAKRAALVALLVAAASLTSSASYGASRVEEAREHAKKEPKNPNAQYDLGLALMTSIERKLRAGRIGPREKPIVAEAEGAYRRAIALAKNHGRAHIMLGMLYNFTGRHKQAIKYLKVGMELPEGSRDWWIAASTLADAYFYLNTVKPSIPVLKKILKHRPDDVSANYKLGLAAMFSGDKALARKQFKKTLKLDPSHAEAKKFLAEVEAKR